MRTHKARLGEVFRHRRDATKSIRFVCILEVSDGTGWERPEHHPALPIWRRMNVDFTKPYKSQPGRVLLIQTPQ